MLVALTINILSKIHRKPSEDMSPFRYKYAKPDARVGGSGMDVELQMTCRGRSSILGPPQLWAQANGFPTRGYFREPSPFRPLQGEEDVKGTAAFFWKYFWHGFIRENIAQLCQSGHDLHERPG